MWVVYSECRGIPHHVRKRHYYVTGREIPCVLLYIDTTCADLQDGVRMELM